MRTLMLLIAVTILAAACTAWAMKAPPSSAPAEAHQSRMSIEEIERQVDTTSLPVLEVKELY
jgi:hypothetical protein